MPSYYDAHHIFPQKFRAKFKKIGIEIDDPKYMRWWKTNKQCMGGTHQKCVLDYNNEWDDFFEENKSNLDKEKTLKKAKELLEKYQITD